MPSTHNVIHLSVMFLSFCALPSTAAAQMDRFDFEFGAGASWTVLNYIETSKDGSPWELAGPFVLQLRYEAVDKTIFNHQANVAEYEGDELNGYLLKNDEGTFRLTDEDPTQGGWYEYYSDPKPFFSVQALPPGGAPLEFRGDWEGQRQASNGWEEWRGQWTMKVTNLGLDTVTVPLGTLQATKFQVEETSTKEVFTQGETGSQRQTWTDYIWLVENVGPLKIMGEGLFKDDHDSNGTWDTITRERWELEAISLTSQTIAVPQPTPQLPSYTSSGGQTQQAVTDALTAVENGLTASPYGNPDPEHGFGMLSGLIQPETGSVETLVDALVADGATSEEAFVKLVIEYDDSLVADFGIDETDLAPYWWDEQADQWILVGTTTDGLEGQGKLATEVAHENLVGYYGIDTVANEVWLNVNHASVYGVLTPVPEPSTLGLLALAGLWRLKRRRR